MTMPTIGPRGGAGDSGAAKADFTPQQRTSLTVLGWLLVYGALVPPVAVILWRLATMPWGDQ